MITRKKLNVALLKLLVLDEADEMLNKGYFDSISVIFKSLPPDCQIALFSTTMSPRCIEFSKEFLRKPTQILVKKKLTIKQFFIKIGGDE